ncbi:MAG: NAD(P)/FAD-dependent oxidoreductase [Actinomycetota bacterium]
MPNGSSKFPPEETARSIPHPLRIETGRRFATSSKFFRTGRVAAVEIAIVGAGMAGLSAAVELHEAGHDVRVVEASDRIGGRVTTDEVDGHLVDRGFQVILAAYPDVWELLDPTALDLKYFIPGAMIRHDGAFHKVADPLQDPASLVGTLRAPIGSMADKLRILNFRRRVRSGSVDGLWRREESTAAEHLAEVGFSEAMIERFLKPLFAGITLDADLGGSSRVLEFVYRMMSQAGVGVPAEAMGALPAQLAGRLPDDALSLSSPVASVNASSVTLESGETIEAGAVVVATDATAAAGLAGTEDHGWRSVTTAWFSAPASPMREPILALNGEGTGPINSVAVMSDVADAYAPVGKATIAVSAPVIADGLVDEMTSQLGQWFAGVDDWDVLRVDEIRQALPVHPVGHDPYGPLHNDDGVWICGDHRTDPSINGAVASGRAVAAAIDRTAPPADDEG